MPIQCPGHRNLVIVMIIVGCCQLSSS